MPWFSQPCHRRWRPPTVPAGSARSARGCRGCCTSSFIKVLRLRPASAAEEEYYGAYGRMGMMGGAADDEECCYYYSYGSSWAGVLSSIPEEDYDDDSSEEVGTPEPDVVVPGSAVLRKAKSERFLVGPHDAATVGVHVKVLL